MRDCRLQTLEPAGERAVAQFRDIVIPAGPRLRWSGFWRTCFRSGSRPRGRPRWNSTRPAVATPMTSPACILRRIVKRRGLPKVWHHAMEYLLADAGRSNLPREQRFGRLRPALVLVGGAW